MDKNISSEPPFQLSSGGLTHLILQGMRGPGAGDFPIQTQLIAALALLWLPLVLLTLIAGTFAGDNNAQPFITDLVPQVRFLIALPLLLLAGMAIDPAVGVAIRNLEASGGVPDDERNRFQAALTELTERRDSIWPDVILLALAYGFTWLYQPGYGESAFEVADSSWLHALSDANGGLSTAGWWYVLISSPLFQFVLFRWIWRFLIWAGFLFQLSRIPLALHPTHPDLAGGLGILGLAQQTFAIVFVAFAAVISSTVAHNMLLKGASFEESRLEVVAFVVTCVVVIYAPLLFFTIKTYTVRRLGLSQYGALGHRLSRAFYAKWIKGAGTDAGTELKASTDPSAMSDYGAVFGTVRNMRFIPASLRNVATVAAALMVPFMPLTLIKFSITDLLQRMAGALV